MMVYELSTEVIVPSSWLMSLCPPRWFKRWVCKRSLGICFRVPVARARPAGGVLQLLSMKMVTGEETMMQAGTQRQIIRLEEMDS